MSRLVNQTRGVELASRLGVARSFLARLRGLSWRRGWGELDGLWIEPCVGVHGLGMLFPVDVALVDPSGVVLATLRLSPFGFGRIHLEAVAAAELPQGTLERTGTLPGDRLEIHAS